MKKSDIRSDQLRLLPGGQYPLAGVYGMGQPDVAADDAAVTDFGAAAKDGGSGVNDHIAADVRVALPALDQRTVRLNSKALRSQCHTLIEFNMGADDGGLADNNTGAVVMKK